MTQLTFHVVGQGDHHASIKHLIIAGWAGRNSEAVEHHIAELEALGVRRPTQIPCFYRVSASLLNNAESIQVPGKDSSGETDEEAPAAGVSCELFPVVLPEAGAVPDTAESDSPFPDCPRGIT